MKKTFLFLLLLVMVVGISHPTWAQGSGGAAAGQQGITDATTAIRGYFEKLVDLMYVISAALALIGGVIVFRKWNAGEQDTQKAATSWFGSMIFMVLVASIIKAFFL